MRFRSAFFSSNCSDSLDISNYSFDLVSGLSYLLITDTKSMSNLMLEVLIKEDVIY